MPATGRGKDQQRTMRERHGTQPPARKPTKATKKAPPKPAPKKAAPPPKAAKKSKKKARRAAKKPAPAPPVEPETAAEEPAAADAPVDRSAWPVFRQRFDADVGEQIDQLREKGLSREDLIDLELAVGAELQAKLKKSTRGTKAFASIHNTFMQSRKQLLKLLELQGKKGRRGDAVKVPDGLRELKPLQRPNVGREVDERPRADEYPDRYK